MRFSDLDGRRIGLWGAGREGRSFATHLRERLPATRIAALVSDDLGEGIDDLVRPDMRVADAAGAVSVFRDCDVIIRSPGVSIYRAELQELAKMGITITTATGLWIAERNGEKIVGVSGTNGKSTTASLIAHLLRSTGREVHLAGNIGRPALDLLDTPPGEWAVIELSSYQIADLPHGPEVGVITNIFDDHADWHGSKQQYRRDKLRLLRLPGTQACVVPAGLEDDCGSGRTRIFGDSRGWHVTADGIRHPDGSHVPKDSMPLMGRHNELNLCAALTAMEAAEVGRPDLPSALRGVRPLPHRLERVCERDGIQWIDDSISTTVESTTAALDTFAGHRAVLIVGGVDRGQDYGELGRRIAEHDAIVLGLPETGPIVVAAAESAGVPTSSTATVRDMEEAVQRAREVAGQGWIVLLSPAAPSFNLYRNFEERGRHFAELADLPA